MSLEGTLDLFGVPDILKLLASTGKSGGLRVTSGQRAGQVWFAGGAVTWASAHTGPAALARRLHGLGAVGPRELTEAVRAAGAGSSLGAALAGTLPAPKLRELFLDHVTDELFELVAWTDGSFRFEPDQAAPEALDPAASVDELLSESERRRKEAPGGPLGEPETRLAVTRRLPGDGAEVTLDDHEWRLVAATGTGSTVAALVEESGQGAFRTRQLLAGLLDRGLLVLAGAEAAADPEEATLRRVLAELEGAGSRARPHDDAPAARTAEQGPARVDRALLDRLITGVRGL